MRALMPVLLLLFCSVASAQSAATVDTLESVYQKCLDRGTDMKGCALRYYGQMDSLLNRVYQRLRLRLAPAAAKSLQAEQRAWLKKREIYFAGIRLPPEFDGLSADDQEMVRINARAEFVQERVRELLKRMALKS